MLTALGTFACYGAAAVFAVLGWLTNNPSNWNEVASTARHRFFATGLAMVGMLSWTTSSFDHHHWIDFAIGLLGGCVLCRRATSWYRIWNGFKAGRMQGEDHHHYH